MLLPNLAMLEVDIDELEPAQDHEIGGAYNVFDEFTYNVQTSVNDSNAS